MKTNAEILVVEDDPASMELISAILTANRYEVLRAKSAKQAMERLQSRSTIDLIVSDIMMPELSGMDLLDYLRTNLRFSHIPTIMCSSLDDQESVVTCLQLGAKDYLVKPIKQESLLQKVERVLLAKLPTVLIVDDDTTVVDMLKNTVTRDQYNTLTATSAEQALEHVKATKVNLVISDINLPAMNGLELTGAIREYDNQIPVLLITGDTQRYKSVHASEAGAAGFFPKPFSANKMIRTIKGLLQPS